jgi:cysteine-S-conjugate beta-lyase
MAKVKIDSLKALHQRRSAKWRFFGPDVIPVPVAEMDFHIAKPIKRELVEMIQRSDTGYSGIVPELAESFAKYASYSWGWAVDTSQVRLAGDVGMAGIEVLRVVTAPGDGVVVNSPVYLNFFKWITEAQRELVDVPLLHRKGDWWLDFDGLEAAFAAGAKAYLLCNPHNPVGSVYNRDELERIAQLAKKYGVTVIADEIHAPLIYREVRFHPYLSVSEEARETGICITSASKAWNLAGLKCAQIITSHPIQDEKLEALPEELPFRSSILGAWASVVAYNEGQPWLDSVLDILDTNRAYLLTLLKEYLPLAKYRIPQSTYLAWIDLSAYQVDNPARVLLEEGHVAVNNGADFGPASSQFVRVNFATDQAILKKAVKRMAEGLKVLEAEDQDSEPAS